MRDCVMLRGKAQMSLEYLAKMIIALVVVAVVIGMIFTFSDDIKRLWDDFVNPDEPEVEYPPIIVPGPFYASDFANVIETCWVEKSNDFSADKVMVCFVLEGSYDGDDINAETDIISLLDADIGSTVVFDADFVNDDMFVVSYIFRDRKIRIKS